MRTASSCVGGDVSNDEVDDCACSHMRTASCVGGDVSNDEVDDCACSPVKTASCVGGQALWRRMPTLPAAASSLMTPSAYCIALTTASAKSGTCASVWTTSKRWD